MSPDPTHCRLCGAEAAIRDSHLIPHFAVRRYYATSPTHAARTVGAPNLRTEGAFVKRLLCGDCENRFGIHEKHWAETVDKPHASRQLANFECQESHRYFAASLAWRTLVWELGPPENLTAKDHALLAKTESALREYLLGRADHPMDLLPWHHLIVAPDAFQDAPTGLNVYLRGGLDPTINGRGDGLYCIQVLGGYLVVTVLSIDPEYLVTWTLGTELRPGVEVRCTPYAFPQDPDFCALLVWRAAAAVASSDLLSPHQRENIRKRVEAVPNDGLRFNPHVIAHMADITNEKMRRQSR